MKKYFLIAVIVVIVVGGLSALFLLLQKNENIVLQTNASIGVWWWSNQKADEYLSFAKENGVDEIYYCDYSLGDDTYNFVKKAINKGMKVYALFGECEWVLNKQGLDALIEKYKIYQLSHQDSKFSGIHLDIEPHQLENFDENTNANLTSFVKMAYDIVNENQDITFDFDIPAWFDKDTDDYKVDLNGNTKAVYQHMIDIANRVFVMSYRDSAEQITAIAEDELIYAKSKNKKLALCVEMSSNEGDSVSFQEESKKIMYEEFDKLDVLLDQDYMISIHHIKTWFELRDK